MYKISYGLWNSLISSFDPDAKAFFDRNPTMSSYEKTIANTLIMSAKNAGNFSLLDEWFIPLKVGDPRIGIFSKTGTLFGGASIDSNGFFDFDGVNGYFDTGFNPTIDGVNYQLNDAITSLFVKSGGNNTTTKVFYGSYSPNATNRSTLFNLTGSRRYAVNSTFSAPDATPVDSNQLYTLSRIVSGNQSLTLDGIHVHTDIENSTSLSSASIYLGSENANGVSSSYADCVASSFAIGAGIGFNHTAHNQYTRIYIASLISGYIVTDLDAANAIINTDTTNPTQAQSISDFVLAEKAAGNWDLIDEFYNLTLGDKSVNGFKGTKATLNGGVVLGIDGAEFNGIDGYIDTNFNPSVDGVNYQPNDSFASVFCPSWTFSANTTLFGTSISNSLRLYFTTSLIRSSVNTTNYREYDTSILEDDALFSPARVSGGNQRFYKNGQLEFDQGRISTGLPNGNIFLGANNNNGAPSNFSDTIISTFAIGASNGFDHASHNINVRNLIDNA